MDVNNIALVRATDIIPFDGVVRPISEEPYLKIKTGSQFGFAISDLLRKTGKIPPVSFRIRREEIDAQQKVLREYLPYISDYNSMVVWSINGLFPDDARNRFANNTFSNEKCVIIDGLAEQLELSDVISLVPTDTTIRGNVKLSNSAIILIEEQEYESLNEQQKELLAKMNIKTFSGDLRQAVEEALSETGRYIPDRPTLNGSDGEYTKSDTSEELKQLIDSIARSNNILQMHNIDIIIDIILYSKREGLGTLANEFENINIVDEYYQRQFFEFLSAKMNLDAELAKKLKNYPDMDYCIKQLCEAIEKYGLDNYKHLVEEYNNGLEKLRQAGKLPTPQQIVDLVRNNDERNIVDKSNQCEMEI